MASGAGASAITGGVFGLAEMGLNMWAQNNQELAKWDQWNQEAQATIRQNQRQALMIKESNKRTADIYGYQTGRFEKNLGFIGDEYSRAGEDLQREMQGAFAQSAYSRQAQLSALAQATGFNAASTGDGNRSRARADVLGTIGTFGRNQAQEAERLAGVVSQTNRNRQALGRQATQSIFNAWGDLGIMPELQKYYGQETPTAPRKMNALMTGIQAAVGGLQSGLNMGAGLYNGGQGIFK